MLAAYQDLDYIDNEAYTYGGQSFGVGYQARFRAGPRTALRTALFTNAILLGATKSDYPSISGREYDFGPGVGAKFVAALSRDGHEMLTLAHDSYFIHSVSGTALNSYVTFTTARFLFPLRQWAAFGVDYILYLADRDYTDYADVSTRNPELRAYLLVAAGMTSPVGRGRRLAVLGALALMPRHRLRLDPRASGRRALPSAARRRDHVLGSLRLLHRRGGIRHRHRPRVRDQAARPAPQGARPAAGGVCGRAAHPRVARARRPLEPKTIASFPESTLVLCPVPAAAYLKDVRQPVRAMRPGDEVAFPHGTVVAVPAHHPGGRRGMDAEADGRALGYVIRTPHGSIYVTGDTDLCPEIGRIGAQYQPEIVVMHVSGHMKGMDAVQAARALGASTIVPVHWGAYGYYWFPEYRQPRTMKVLRAQLGETLVPLALGESLPLGRPAAAP